MLANPEAPPVVATRVAATDQTTRTLVMLHGIYGRGRNWQSIARAVVATRPEYACWLVDLPHHGDSGPGRHGDTVTGLAVDVEDWLHATSIVPDAVLGHSYGGKVALAIASRLSRPLQVWVIDSTPEVKTPSGSAWTMMRIIRGLPSRFGSRDEAVSAIVAGGYPVGVAQWMSTNLSREGDGFVWRLDFDAMERLLNDFFATDLWSVIEQAGAPHEVHVLKASESSAISPEAVVRLESAAGPSMHLYHRPGGHWIHAESPDIVTELLVAHLP
ncbi:MAG TPA: alpha/beta hydrolase [Vicinamibacterales bacterium]|nr:alpha/beta hydrolase [Vicinamibacterales bacterium]